MKKMILGVALSLAATAFAADHIEAPLAVAHPATDFCDFYAWTQGDRLVVALTVNPFYAGAGQLFDRSARYNIWIDNDMDARPDMSLRIDFGGLGNMIVGGSLRRHVRQIWSGSREDPFFFDLGLLGSGLNGSDTLTPDILTIDTAQPTAYPNGRALIDDVIDISLGLVFGEGTDEIEANDVPFLSAFPYLAPPNGAAKGAAEESAAALPADFSLGAAHPNPFNPSTEIPFELARDGLVRLEVYNLAGQRIRSLVDGTRQAGAYAIAWDARDDQGRDVASGIYLYRLNFSGGPGRAGFSASRRMTLLR